MPEEAFAGGERPGAAGSILQQIREEMRRSYRPREESIDAAEAGEPSSGELAELRSAVAALYSSYALVGQAPPEPPTLRGRIGARFVKLVQRLLFWYTPQIVHFQYSALRTFESALRAFEGQAKSLRQLEAEARRERQDLQTAVAAAISRIELQERRLEEFGLQALPRINREITRLRAQQTVLEGRIDSLPSSWNEVLDDPSRPAPAERPRREETHRTDAFYAALEDEFRGSRQEIKQRLSVYLPRLIEAGIGSEGMPILDVGCGRGEWVELLREHDLQAAGIDLNRVLLAICREHGLPATEADAVKHLRNLPEASLGAVTGFHIIEHLTLPQLLDLLEAAWRTLKPGGVAIFETPNPSNMFVSSQYFYLDPTHRHPIPPALGRFLAETSGFERVEIMELHPWPEEHHVDTATGGAVAARFNECFYGPQDYAIIGWKA